MHRLIASIGLLVVLLACSAANATKVLCHHDLISLCAVSPVVIQAEVGTSEPWKTRDGDCLVHTVRVLKVIRGNLTPDTTIKVAGLDLYVVNTTVYHSPGDECPIPQGAIVYLFMAPTPEARSYSRYRLTDAPWTVTDSGVRLVADKQVYAFGQSPPIKNNDFSHIRMAGTFVTMVDPPYTNAPIVPESKFEDQLADAFKSADVLKERFASKKLDPELLKALRDERKRMLKAELANFDFYFGHMGEFGFLEEFQPTK